MRKIFDQYSDIFIHNEYYKKYMQLCDQNEEVCNENTQIHHIIPRSYFKNLSINVNNDEDNLVSLSFKNHILAHYYLYFCISDDFYCVKKSSAIMVFLNTGIYLFNNPVIDFENIICQKDWDEICMCAKDTIRSNSRGTTFVNDGEQVFKIKKDQLEYYLHNGFNYGIIRKGVQITNGVEYKYVKKSEIQQFLSDGWRIGHCHKTSQKIKGYRTIHNGDKEKLVPQTEIENYVKNGWELGRSELSKEHQKQNQKPPKYKGTKGVLKGTTIGYVWVTNGIKRTRVPKEKVDKFLADNPGWHLGYIKCIWLNDGKRNIRATSDQDVESLLNAGCFLGMVKRKNN